jgi:integration host factor subunit alpha
MWWYGERSNLENQYMSITKERISAKIAKSLAIQADEARSHLDSLLEIIKGSLANDQDVLISGFGKFSVRRKMSRHGRNPKTGEPLELRARRGDFQIVRRFKE